MRYRNIINAVQNKNDPMTNIDVIRRLVDNSIANITLVDSEYGNVSAGGKSKKMLVEQAKRLNADLIVINNNNHKLSKAMTKRLLKSSPCDVLIVNSE